MPPPPRRRPPTAGGPGVSTPGPIEKCRDLVKIASLSKNSTRDDERDSGDETKARDKLSGAGYVRLWAVLSSNRTRFNHHENPPGTKNQLETSEIPDDGNKSGDANDETFG